eukprot:1186745-Prorocentrum_minimum.AAC.3
MGARQTILQRAQRRGYLNVSERQVDGLHAVTLQTTELLNRCIPYLLDRRRSALLFASSRSSISGPSELVAVHLRETAQDTFRRACEVCVKICAWQLHRSRSLMLFVRVPEASTRPRAVATARRAVARRQALSRPCKADAEADVEHTRAIDRYRSI